jgi:hypothetical protein
MNQVVGDLDPVQGPPEPGAREDVAADHLDRPRIARRLGEGYVRASRVAGQGAQLVPLGEQSWSERRADEAAGPCDEDAHLAGMMTPPSMFFPAICGKAS